MDYIASTLNNLVHQTAFFNLTWGNYLMIAVACFFLYLAIRHEFEPLLLVPIAFGMLLVNIYPDIMLHAEDASNGVGGLLYYFYVLDEWAILPSLIFMGVGAMTDFGPLIANPKSFLLGAAAQFGIFAAYFGAIFMGFNDMAAAAISIIGGADGPTSIFLASKLGQTAILGPIAVAAYSYMSLVPIIQPPIMKLLTTEKERKIKMGQLRPVSKLEKILFPIVVTIVVCLILPTTAPLVGMLMLGNLFRESGVVRQLTETASNALMYIVVILLGTSVGATTSAEAFLNWDTLKIVALGLIAFMFEYGRCAVRQDYVQVYPWQDQPSDWFRGRVSRSHGGPCVPEGRRGGGSHQLPADACHGPQCGRRYRNRRCGRYLHGYLRGILRTAKRQQVILTITKICQAARLTSESQWGLAANFIAREYKSFPGELPCVLSEDRHRRPCRADAPVRPAITANMPGTACGQLAGMVRSQRYGIGSLSAGIKNMEEIRKCQNKEKHRLKLRKRYCVTRISL